ncbi:MAG: thioredoxin family protein [Bacteroidota bacterium]|nr:thioredoxin family protein [Bacteroidota bacterium]
MKNTYLLIIILFVFLVSCKSQNKKNNKGEDETTEVNVVQNNNNDEEETKNYYKKQRQIVEGYVKGGANLNVIIDELGIGEINPLISVIIDESGGFNIDTEIPEPGIYQLRFPNGSIHLFLRGGKVTIKTDISNLGDYEIIGSQESYHLKEMYMLLNKTNNKLKAIQKRAEDYKKDKKNNKKLLALVDSMPIYYSAIGKEKSQNLRKFIDRIDTSMVAILTALYLDVDENYNYLIELRDKFEKICPHSKFYKQFDDKISAIIPTGPGVKVAEIALADYNNKEYLLSSLEGNVTLLYFWASFDNKSRQDNILINSLFDKYKNKGFKIYSVSLDSEKDEWKDAIVKDKISEWINVSDLEGWQSQIANIYRIDGLPYLILINKKGIIIDRGFKSHELESRIKGLLK